ncbi:MAG: ABC transporter substrate-binding protein [Clostridia bacterium]
MKKLSVVLVTFVLMLAFAAPVLSEPLSVGVVQLAENGAFTDMREGFIARMRDLGYAQDRLTFDVRNASGDMSNLYTICQGFADTRPCAVVTIATPPTQAMVNLESELPVFFISVSNPTAAGVITDMAHPDKLATGTSNAIPVDEMFKLSDRLTPGVTSYGFIYCTSQVNSVSTVENAKAYLDSVGISYHEAVVATSSEVYEAMLSLVGAGVGAIFVPNDSVVQDAMAVVAEVASDAKIPVYGSSSVMVRSGAFATISISDTAIGALTADMLDQYLKGTPVDQIPAIVVNQFTTVINTNTASAIGVTLPPDVLASAELVQE